jgi:anti-sigma28 factor (negative regulator of flagellin synthesis)
VSPGTRVPAQGGQVLVSVDEALRDVAQLRQTAITLAETANAAQRQADAAVAALATSQDSAPPPHVAAAQAEAEEASQESQEATVAISQAIRSGNYEVLRTKNRTLTDATRQSVAARTRVITAER